MIDKYNISGNTGFNKPTTPVQSECNGLLSKDRTTRGIKMCADWLSVCLNNGWKKHQLDGLEKIWWEHRDRNGDLK